MRKKILIRADASHKIGIGHVMRCLTLANEAQRIGWKVCFVLRDPSEHIIQLISYAGHGIRKLTSNKSDKKKSVNQLQHEDWLGVSQEKDAVETTKIIEKFKPNWVIVDHYAMDATWHSIVKKKVDKILVIDDLGDRKLICDLLLDQNLGANAEKYICKVSKNCKLLLGPEFGLLRNEFKEWRERSLRGRLGGNIEKVLITMGGVDATNYTQRILKELTKSKYVENCEFIVIIGGSYPHVDTLYDFLESSVLKISVLSNVTNMAEIMSGCDLCIGAAGSTSWERCCLGQPTITFSIANNQKEIAEQLCKRGISIYSNIGNLKHDFEQFFGASGRDLQQTLSLNARLICDGLGASRVVEELEKTFEN